MPATFQWSESNGAEVETIPITNANFGSVDAPNIVPIDNLVLRGQNSFSKYIRGKFTGVWTTISNLKFWKSSGDYKTGESIKASIKLDSEYATPSQVATGDSALPITEETGLTVKSAEGEDTIEYGVTGVSGYTSYVRLQAQTLVTMPLGLANEKEFTLSFDEI
jgi:hypothetical protein